MSTPMKAVILAGGVGTRISEETQLKPKPMVEVGGRPILWHIMKIFSSHGIHDFIICTGYRGYLIKEYFANYSLHTSDVTFRMKENETIVHHRYSEPWNVTLVDTGESTMTGGRLKRVKTYLDGKSFCMTYGDGLADVNLTSLLKFHRKQGKLATVTAVQPPGRWGSLKLSGSKVKGFSEKPRGDGNWVNGGFFVLEPRIFDFIKDDQTVWEQKPIADLSKEGQLAAFPHRGFWHAMDTLRDKLYLEKLWDSGDAPWKRW